MNNEPSSQNAPWYRSADKLLLLAGGLYFIGVCAWLMQRSQQGATVTNSTIQSPQTVEVITQEDQEFITYLQQSLETVRNPQPVNNAFQAAPLPPAQTAPQPTVAVVPPQPTTPPPPPTIRAESATPASTSPTTIVERYYYPVYPNAQAPTAPPLPVAVAPPVLAEPKQNQP